MTPFERMLTHYAAEESGRNVRFDPALGQYLTVEDNEVWAPVEDSAIAFDLAIELGMEVRTPRVDGLGEGRVRYRQIVKTAAGNGVDERKTMRLLIVEAAAQDLVSQTDAYLEGTAAAKRMKPCPYDHDSIERSLWTHGYHCARVA